MQVGLLLSMSQWFSMRSPSMSRSLLSFSAILLGCALLPVSSFAQLSFESHPVAQAGTVTIHGDFNNDGREDLVVGNQLYLSTGDGIYQAPTTLPASIAAIGDFNHDGKLDFVSS